MNVRVAEAVVTLVHLSREYPTAEIRLTIKGGHIVLGIPKGEVGDRIMAEWDKLAPEVKPLHVGMS